jgi:hypothetical protein
VFITAERFAVSVSALQLDPLSVDVWYPYLVMGRPLLFGADQLNVSVVSPAVKDGDPIFAGLAPRPNNLPPLPAAIEEIKGIVSP